MVKGKTVNEKMWRDVGPGTVLLDFTGCEQVGQLHDILRKGFGFPGYYGENWDALWDCMRDFAASQHKKREVRIYGFGEMPAELREYALGMLKVFREVEDRYPNIVFLQE